jgi:plastocyanin
MRGVKMKLFYVTALVLMVLVSACAQQTDEQAPLTEPEPVAEPEVQPVAEDVEVEETAEVTSEEVRLLRGSIEPLELTISVGSAVTFINDGGLTSVIYLEKDGASYMNSPILKDGEKFEHEFTEAGEYEYWGIAYGPQGAKIIVE